MSKHRIAVAGLLLLSAAPGRAAGPTLLGDFNPARVGEESFARPVPLLLTGVGPRAVLALGDGFDGSTTYWATDGTPAGTRPVARFEFPHPEPLGVASGALLFAHGPEPFIGLPALWRTDGTPEGTRRLPEVMLPRPFSRETAGLGGSLFFQGCTPESGCELWRSDGTAKGTVLVKDLTSGRYSSAPRLLTLSGERLFFFAVNPDGVGLWVSDGTRTGTRRVALLPLGKSPRRMAAAGSGVVFTVAGRAPHEALWTSDGSPAGTRPLPPFDRATRASPPLGELVGGLGNLCLFTATKASERELWATDGTLVGTRRLARFPRAAFALHATRAAAVNGEILFAGPSLELWSTRGTPSTTRRLTACPGGCPQLLRLPFQPLFARLADRLIFGGLRDGRLGLWVSDGNEQATAFLADLPGLPQLFAFTVGGLLYFNAGPEVWTTDGTAAGTRPAADARFSASSLAAPAGTRLAFVAQSAESGFDLLATDGTPEGSATLVNLESGAGSRPQGFRPFGDKTFFTTCFAGRTTLWISEAGAAVRLLDAPAFCSDFEDPRSGRPVPLGDEAYFLWINPGEFWAEVWRTDGTPAGTVQVTHLGPEVDPFTLTPFAGKLLFTSTGAQTTTSFWQLDGTDAVQLFAIEVGRIFRVEVFGDEMFFVGEGEEGESLLFHSDGTAAGTAAVGRVFGAVTPLAHVDGVLFFLSAGSFWRSDGTAAGTRQVLPNPLHGGHPHSFTGGVFVKGVFLLANSGGLFKTDGTAAGTALVAAIDPGPFADIVEPRVTLFQGRVAFVAADAEHGAELWLSDGTREGTALVRDIRPGEQGSGVASLVAAGGRLFFTADDGVHGAELWESDGTFEGTRLVADLIPGAESSFPRSLTVSGSSLFFAAEDGVNGREPWVLEVDAP